MCAAPFCLQEVRQILGGDNFAFELRNQKIDLPELQGKPEDISREKCRLAAKEVGWRSQRGEDRRA